jgi:hypothetical protein
VEPLRIGLSHLRSEANCHLELWRREPGPFVDLEKVLVVLGRRAARVGRVGLRGNL